MRGEIRLSKSPRHGPKLPLLGTLRNRGLTLAASLCSLPLAPDPRTWFRRKNSGIADICGHAAIISERAEIRKWAGSSRE